MGDVDGSDLSPSGSGGAAAAIAWTAGPAVAITPDDGTPQDPNSIQVVDSATLMLTWSAANASLVNIDPLGQGLPVSGAMPIPTSDGTFYTLVAIGTDGVTQSDPFTIGVHTHPDGDPVSPHATVNLIAGTLSNPQWLTQNTGGKVFVSIDNSGVELDQAIEFVIERLGANGVWTQAGPALTATASATGTTGADTGFQGGLSNPTWERNTGDGNLLFKVSADELEGAQVAFTVEKKQADGSWAKVGEELQGTVDASGVASVSFNLDEAGGSGGEGGGDGGGEGEGPVLHFFAKLVVPDGAGGSARFRVRWPQGDFQCDAAYATPGPQQTDPSEEIKSTDSELVKGAFKIDVPEVMEWLGDMWKELAEQAEELASREDPPAADPNAAPAAPSASVNNGWVTIKGAPVIELGFERSASEATAVAIELSPSEAAAAKEGKFVFKPDLKNSIFSFITPIEVAPKLEVSGKLTDLWKGFFKGEAPAADPGTPNDDTRRGTGNDSDNRTDSNYRNPEGPPPPVSTGPDDPDTREDLCALNFSVEISCTPGKTAAFEFKTELIKLQLDRFHSLRLAGSGSIELQGVLKDLEIGQMKIGSSVYDAKISIGGKLSIEPNWKRIVSDEGKEAFKKWIKDLPEQLAEAASDAASMVAELLSDLLDSPVVEAGGAIALLVGAAWAGYEGYVASKALDDLDTKTALTHTTCVGAYVNAVFTEMSDAPHDPPRDADGNPLPMTPEDAAAQLGSKWRANYRLGARQRLDSQGLSNEDFESVVTSELKKKYLDIKAKADGDLELWKLAGNSNFAAFCQLSGADANLCRIAWLATHKDPNSTQQFEPQAGQGSTLSAEEAFFKQCTGVSYYNDR